MYCKKCGKENEQNSKYCMYCGAEIGAQDGEAEVDLAERKTVSLHCQICENHWEVPFDRVVGGFVICPSCGMFVEVSESENESVPQPPMQQLPTSDISRKKDSKLWIIITAVIVVIAIAVGVVFIAGQKGKGTAVTTTGVVEENSPTVINNYIQIICIQPTDNDFKALETGYFSWLAELAFPDFDCNTTPSHEVFENQIAGIYWPLYDEFYGNSRGYSRTVPASNVEWIMKNVLNIDPSRIEHEYQSEYSNYSDGYYTYTREINIEPGEREFISMTKQELDNNLYKITIRSHNYSYTEATIEAIAGVKEVDGKRIWSFVSVKRVVDDLPDETTITTTKKATPTTTTKNNTSDGALVPTDAEWNEFKNKIIKNAWFNELWVFPANYDDYSTRGYLANSFFTLGTGESLIYNYYFNDGKRISYSSQKDPLDRFGNNIQDDHTDGRYYYKYKKENVDWIVKNVMNMTPEQVDHLGDDWFGASYNYYYDGYYYCVESDSGEDIRRDTGFYFKSKTDLGNGKYKVVLGVYDSTLSEVVVGIKNVNGKRIWTLYSVTPIYREGH